MLFLKNILSFFLTIIIIFTFFELGAQGQNGGETQEPFKIGITTGSFTPEVTNLESLEIFQEEIFKEKYFRIIQFYEVPPLTLIEKWESEGLSLTDYLPGMAYFAVIDQNFDLTKLKNEIRSVVQIDSKFKLDFSLFLKRESLDDSKIKLIIEFFKGLNAEDVKKDMTRLGIAWSQSRLDGNQLEVVVSGTSIEDLVNIPYIQFVSFAPSEPILENENLSYRNATDRSNYLNTGFNGINYNGSGVTIAIGEGGTVGLGLDFKGRKTELVSSSFSDHKLGCTENAGGAGNLDPQNRSHAWGAQILSTNNENYPSLITTYGTRYFNHSYGFGIQGGYNTEARAHDLRIVDYPNHLISYSSGNTGDDPGYAPYNFNGWGNITGAIKQNKNHMVIANLSPNDDILSWGCKGPAYDGRLMPHLTVAGPEGTSYASPKVVGLFAQLEQAYKSYNGGSESPSALMRAIIFNTADDIGNPGPDFKTGYGRPNARKALQVIESNQVFSGSLLHGASANHNIIVPAGTKKIKIMIVWPDVAAAVNATPAIVNNLNILATDPNNNTYLPWVLDHTPNPVNLNANATRQIDNLNTIEQITVDNPITGTWNIQVSGANIPMGSQNYYIAYQFENEELQMAYPLANEKMKSGDIYYLKWDSYGLTGSFTLEYQLNGGSWIKIDDGIEQSKRSYSWVAPYVEGVQNIKFRVRQGNILVESDVNQISQNITNFRINKVCADVVTLKWSPLVGASSYKVYKLGASYMEEVTTNITFDGSSAVLTGQSTSSSEYYAVSAMTGSIEGLKSHAIEKTPGDFSCGGIDWTGNISTDWFDNGNWSTNMVPTSAENVNIPSQPVNQPLIANSGAVCNSITIQSGASLTMSSTIQYTLAVHGDWTNNGIFNAGLGIVDFTSSNAYQEIGGMVPTNFYSLKVTKGNISRIVEVTSLITLTASTNPLVITSGTFKLSSASTITPFTTGSGAELDANKCIWNNGGIINYGNFSWFNNGGTLRLSGGTFNCGTNAGNNIIYLNNGKIIIEGGSLNIAGSLRPNSGTSLGTFSLYAGNITVCAVGCNNTDRGGFELNAGVPFIMIGGNITIRRASSNSTADIIILSTSSLIGHGTINIGDASTPPSQNIRINSIAPFYDLTINPNNTPTATLVTNNLVIKNNLANLGGTLNANNLDINVKGNWTNNGSFVSGTGNVTFNGNATQCIQGTATTSFHNLTIDGNDVLINTTAIPFTTNVSGLLNINENKKLTLPVGQILNGN